MAQEILQTKRARHQQRSHQTSYVGMRRKDFIVGTIYSNRCFALLA